MNTTGIFDIHKFEIKATKYGEPIYIIPFGDIHRNAPLCHVEKWVEFLDWAKRKRNAYFLGMGDYDDLASASERMILMDRKLHESTRDTIEDLYRKLTDRLAKELSFMSGRLIGLIEGNHFGEFQNGTTTTQRLAEKLNCKYLGVSAFVRLQITTRGTRQGVCVDVWAHHGMGAARLIGGSLNRVQQMLEAAEADLYLMGHDHKKSVGMVSRLELRGSSDLRLHNAKKVFARTGSFLKGYEPGKKSYIVDKAMNPTDLGVVKIELTPKRERIGGADYEYIDMHASI